MQLHLYGRWKNHHREVRLILSRVCRAFGVPRLRIGLWARLDDYRPPRYGRDAEWGGHAYMWGRSIRLRVPCLDDAFARQGILLKAAAHEVGHIALPIRYPDIDRRQRKRRRTQGQKAMHDIDWHEFLAEAEEKLGLDEQGKAWVNLRSGIARRNERLRVAAGHAQARERKASREIQAARTVSAHCLLKPYGEQAVVLGGVFIPRLRARKGKGKWRAVPLVNGSSNRWKGEHLTDDPEYRGERCSVRVHTFAYGRVEASR